MRPNPDEDSGPPKITPNREAAKKDLALRTTEKVARSGYCPVPTLFLNYHHRLKLPDGKGLSPNETLLLLQIYSFKRGANLPFPGVETLAARLDVSDRAIRKMLVRLEQGGLVRRIHDTHKPNRYDLTGLWEKLEAFADAEVAEIAARINAKLAAAKLPPVKIAAGAGALPCSSSKRVNASPSRS